VHSLRSGPLYVKLGFGVGKQGFSKVDGLLALALNLSRGAVRPHPWPLSQLRERGTVRSLLPAVGEGPGMRASQEKEFEWCYEL
jgi:hypothetical protein